MSTCTTTPTNVAVSDIDMSTESTKATPTHRNTTSAEGDTSASAPTPSSPTHRLIENIAPEIRPSNTNTTPDITPADTNVTPEVSYESGYTLQIPDMTKLGTFHGEMNKLGAFSVTLLKGWTICV